MLLAMVRGVSACAQVRLGQQCQFPWSPCNLWVGCNFHIDPHLC
jgi:hypothetical protein